MLIPSSISRVLFLQRSWQNGCGHCRSVATTAFWHQRTQYDGFAPNKLSGESLPPLLLLPPPPRMEPGGRWEWLIASRNRSVATVLLHLSGKSIAAAAAEIFLSAAESKSMSRVDLYSPRFKIYEETHPRFIYGVLCWEPLFCWYYWFSKSKKFPQFKMSYYTLNSNIWHLANISGRHGVVQHHLFCFPVVWVSLRN